MEKMKSKQWGRNVMRRIEGGKHMLWQKIKVGKPLALYGHVRSYLEVRLPC